MCTAWLISATICTQILPRQGGPQSTILGIRKLETLSYLTVKTTSLCVPSFWVNTNQSVTDRQTDKWMDLPSHIACKAMSYELCRKPHMNSNHCFRLVEKLDAVDWVA